MPPLSLLHLENFQKGFKTFDGDPTKGDNITFFIDTVHAAMKRNYPECTREEIAEGIGMEMMEEMLKALITTSGLVHRTEALDLGEPQADVIQN